ncbi:hypothetical protein B0J11DRAFT_519871 [Dendryphion nanum]|uniref:Uncharacterized protein n=1 Tax=Dendryphion nanum TaxID=256645 RepID=A0A9P9EFC3_9PLEO|nr:hypothetical protein B0J11DRAFT_519871 [Dendryphion nanum]
MSLLTPLPHLFTTTLSTYALYLSYQNITRLRTYESQSEKAAEWSNTAADRLQRTRTTQAGSTIALTLSLLTSTSLLFTSSSSSPYFPYLCLVSAAYLGAARIHSGRFWNEKEQTRIPFLQKFNDAVRGSERVVQVLGLLAWTWAGIGVGGFIGGRK